MGVPPGVGGSAAASASFTEDLGCGNDDASPDENESTPHNLTVTRLERKPPSADTGTGTGSSSAPWCCWAALGGCCNTMLCAGRAALAAAMGGIFPMTSCELAFQINGAETTT